jgi:hypothetical protein
MAEKIPRAALREVGLQKCGRENKVSVIKIGDYQYRCSRYGVSMEYWTQSGTASINGTLTRHNLEPSQAISWLLSQTKKEEQCHSRPARQRLRKGWYSTSSGTDS